MVLIAGGIFWWQRAQAKPLTDQDVLVLADFTNTTGDAAFDGALRQALAFELEQSPFLKIMDDQEVNQTLQLMGRPAGQRITNDIAHEVCVREGQKATIGGSIAGLGKTYQIALRAINCQTGATLAREQAEAEDKEHVLKARGEGRHGDAGQARGVAEFHPEDRTESASMDGDHQFPRSAQSLPAGIWTDCPGLAREAIPQLQRAIELDPNFASAYMFLGIAYGNSGQTALAAEDPYARHSP